VSASDETTGERRYASRGGHKLEHALDVFELDVRGLECVDLGCSTGGFTDCLLQRGVAHVTAIDTAYGIIDYRLRTDERVTLLERTNALHAAPRVDSDLAELVVIDLGWTPQLRALPAARRWLKPSPGSRIITLIKPHYEKSARDRTGPERGGVLAAEEAELIVAESLDAIRGMGFDVIGCVRSPIVGVKSGRKSAGNAEWLALLAPGDSRVIQSCPHTT